MTTSVRVTLVTVPSEEVGANIARTLVDERLAACVNLVPGIRSIYRWQGKIEDERELLLIIKTSVERVGSLTRRVKELHPYTVPEVIVLPVEGGLSDYLEWVGHETGKVVY